MVNLGCLLFAAVRLAAPFTDGVVLQRDRPVRVWGRAAVGERVTVAFAGRTAEASTDASGAWAVELPPFGASKEPRTLTVTGADSRAEAKDVLVGEVWMCAGQSNAACPIWGKSARFRDGMGAMTIQTTSRPFVRLVKVPCEMAVSPQADVKVVWLKMTPQDLDFARGVAMPSALGYYFALDLFNALDVPIGLVDCSWGGTNIDAWTPRSGYDGIAGLDRERNWTSVPRKDWKPEMAVGPVGAAPQQPSVIWNRMVAPFAPMSVRGFIWYQGCHNSDRGESRRYAGKMHALYNGWAKEFRNPELSLRFVQLAPWGSASIPHIQEAQARFAAEEPHASMAVINDVGNLTDIHPNDKRTPAKRLVAQALRRDYGWTWVKDSSPTLAKWRIEGDRFILSFADAEGWYVYNPKYGDVSVGFEVAGADGVFKPATLVNAKLTPRGAGRPDEFRGEVEGRDLVVRAADVSAPKMLRYLHARPWFGGLYNEVGLPLGAFHIGHWNDYLDVPPRYDRFKRKVEKIREFPQDGYVVEEYRQANGPDTHQRVLLAVPKDAKGRLPAVVAPFYFPEAMLGFDPATGAKLEKYAEIAYMGDLVKRGYVVASAESYHLTYDRAGAPRDDWQKWRHAGEKLARDYPEWTGVGKLAFDTRLLVDLVAADPRVDATRIGIIGHSLGGKMAFYAGCLDPRVKVIVASDFGIGWDQTNWKDVWYWGARLCAARAEGLDHAGLLSLAKGKPFCLIAGKFDDATSGETMHRAAGYESHPERLKLINHATGHRPPRDATQAGYEFLDTYLKE